MNRRELYLNRQAYFLTEYSYKMVRYDQFDFDILKKVMYIRRAGRGNNDSYADCIIMADTETSKKKQGINENHVCAFTVSIRAFDTNICTLYGNKPSECIECMTKIHEAIGADHTIIYFHNYAYDYVFLRKFMFRKWDFPTKVLNTNPHNPILMEFANGIVIKDSLILAQRKLESWADDLEVEHRKSVGKWDYDKYRGQNEIFSPDEMEYIEHDTLAGVECLQKLMDNLHKRIYSMPYTATGIPREEVRNRGKENNAHDRFVRQALTYAEYLIFIRLFHGGFTHGNRFIVNVPIYAYGEESLGLIKCYDFSSSYPYVMLAYKYPAEKYAHLDGAFSIDDVLKMGADDYSVIFKLRVYKPELKDAFNPMPTLQVSKCDILLEPINDNGRVLTAEYAELWMTEVDLEIFADQYKYEKAVCTECMTAKKKYLPRWFTDYVFELYEAKCKLKGGPDPVSYALAKAKLNSLYGLTVQKNIKENIVEDYATGEYSIDSSKDMEDAYNIYVKRYTSVLPYQIGVYVTCYAMRNLILGLAKCVKPEDEGGCHLYSDTDSCYAQGWDENKVAVYNENCKALLRANNYGPVIHNGREFWLGIAESEGDKDLYTEYMVQGAKRYCGRCVKDGELHITVAGVPKRGAVCLNNDINNFRKGMIFKGEKTNKKLHTYFYVPDIYIDDNGNETGDSIDLSPCDYLLDSVRVYDWDRYLEESDEIYLNEYEEGMYDR